MGQIHLQQMEFYAYHGHLDEEQIVGNKFLVDLKLDTNMSKPCQSDCLEDAVDYQKAYQLVEQEMKQTARLLEHVAQRILNALKSAFSHQLEQITVTISKLNPPVGGKVDRVSVTVTA